MAADENLSRLIKLLATGEGILALAVFAALVAYVLVSTNGRWFTLTILLYAATLGIYQNEWFISVLVSPLQQIRSYGRAIVFGLLAVLFFPSFETGQSGFGRKAHIGAVAFLAFQLLFSARLMTSGVFGKGCLASVAFMMTFVVFGVGLSRWLRSIADVHKLLRSMVGVGFMLCAATVYQSIHDTSAIYWNYRYFGTTGNAQHAATMIAMILPPGLYLITSPQEPRRLRCLWGATVSILVLLLLWTGSRTGVAMSILGVAILGRRQIWRFLPGALVIAIGSFVVLQFLLPESLMTIDRYTSTLNTRGAPFEDMTRDFLSSPLVGVGGETLAESSYLGTAAKMGVFGLMWMAAVYWLIGRDIWRLARLRSNLGAHPLLFDLILAGFVPLALGASVEGYLLAVFNFPVLATYCYCALLAFVLEAACQQRGGVASEMHSNPPPVNGIEAPRF